MKIYTPIRATHIVSEPGDCTHYDYIVYCDDEDVFHFMPCQSTFNYPQHIPLWSLDDENIDDLAKKFECSPCTVAECMRTMREMIKE